MKQYKVGEWPLFDLEISELEDVTILHISLDMLIADFLSINIIVDELEDNYFGDKKKTFTKELSFRDVIVYEHNRQKHPQYSETMKKINSIGKREFQQCRKLQIYRLKKI